MAISDDFSISEFGDIRHTSGSTVYTVLELHAWLQDLADEENYSSNDYLDILSPNPSKLDGPRDVAVASRLNLLTNGSISYNIDDVASRFINFGSIKQLNFDDQYSGLRTIGDIVPSSPIYIVQNDNKLTKFWSDDHIQILVKVKSSGSFVANGDVTAFSRKWGQTYSHFDINLSAGGETSAAISTSIDNAILLTEEDAALLSSKVSITIGDIYYDLGNGNGSRLYKGTIALSNSCTLQEAYQYLQYLTRENSSSTINSVPGWRYRKLSSSYPEVITSPFGTFAGGTFFVARGWLLTGVLQSESTKYQLIDDSGTIQVPPTIVLISIGNLISGDRVLVTRNNGSGEILKDEYTPEAASIGSTTITVLETIKSSTPSSGIVRIKGRAYAYSSFNSSTKTFTLTSGLLDNIITSDDVFVPFIDKLATSSVESVFITYDSTFDARVDVRRGSGLSPIIPFTTLFSVTSSGASVNTNRNSDV